MINILEIVVLSLAISLDSFVSAFGYSVSKIKIPFLSMLVLSLTSVASLALSCFLGKFIAGFLSLKAISYIAFSLLSIVGFYKLFSGLASLDSTTKADSDNNKILSPLECLGLGFMLSIDSLGVGLSYGMQAQSSILLIATSFVFTFLSIFLGNLLGKNIAKKCKLNLSFLSGVALLVLAFIKLF